jgi:hypothetical protein
MEGGKDVVHFECHSSFPPLRTVRGDCVVFSFDRICLGFSGGFFFKLSTSPSSFVLGLSKVAALQRRSEADREAFLKRVRSVCGLSCSAISLGLCKQTRKRKQ